MRNDMKFSLVLASRNRIDILSSFLDSLNNTTKNLHEIEVLIGIDNDDLLTCEASIDLEKKYSFVRFHKRERSINLNNDYLNWLTGMSKGIYIIACNDDIIVKTKDWDEIALSVLNDYLKDKPDKVVYGFLDDALLDRQKLGYSCFPLISRQSIDALGWLMPPEFVNWNADVVLWKIFNGVNRVCKIPIMFEHFSYHSGMRGRDEINNSVEVSFSKSALYYWDYDEKNDVSKLLNYINKNSNIPVGKNNKIISILVYTKGRPNFLMDFIQSVKNNAKNSSAVEILVVYDSDDKKTIGEIPNFNRIFSGFCRFYGRNKNNLINKYYFNWLCKFANGSLISICDDDCVFKTMHWDDILINKTNEFVKEKENKSICVFLKSDVYFISKESIKLLNGNMVNPDLPYYGHNDYNKRVFSYLDLLLEVDDIEIIKNPNKKNDDFADQYFKRISYKTSLNPKTIDISRDVELIKKNMNE